MLTFVEAYLEGFKKHYPEKDVRVQYRRKHDAYAVFIDGSAGDRLLSESELREATRMFNH
jgi:hypothetical protein